MTLITDQGCAKNTFYDAWNLLKSKGKGVPFYFSSDSCRSRYHNFSETRIKSCLKLRGVFKANVKR